MEHLSGLLLLLALGAVYFLPALIAASRRHHQQKAILVLNLFFGITVLGWVVALVWACTATTGDAEW